jgi:hypothetical protein
LNSSAALTSLVWSLAFRPKILLGAQTARGTTTGGIGGFLSLPRLSVNITRLSNVDQKCEKTTNLPGILMGNFTNIMPTIDLEAGVLGQLDIEALDLSYKRSTQIVLTSTQYTLPTTCVDFQAGTYGTPTRTTSTRTATATASSIAAAHAASSTAVKGRAEKRDNGLYSMGSYVVLVMIISTMGLYGWM